MRNLPRGFDIYLVNVKTMRKIAQVFVALVRKAELYEIKLLAQKNDKVINKKFTTFQTSDGDSKTRRLTFFGGN